MEHNNNQASQPAALWASGTRVRSRFCSLTFSFVPSLCLPPLCLPPSLPLSSTHTPPASLPLGIIKSTCAHLVCQSIQICRCLGTWRVYVLQRCIVVSASAALFPNRHQILPSNTGALRPMQRVGSDHFWITRNGTICASLEPWPSAAGRSS